jgi:hypothetical protein
VNEVNEIRPRSGHSGPQILVFNVDHGSIDGKQLSQVESQMIRLIFMLSLGLGLCHSAVADIWKWTDANGDVHYVATRSPIYTWVDSSGKVHWADTPYYEGAVQVKLVWYSNSDMPTETDPGSNGRQASNLDEEMTSGGSSMREFRCDRATQIRDYYADSDKLYRTDEDGNKVYLTDEEMEQKLKEVRATVEEWCE